ncbi:MAG: glutaminase [Lapillicoccus sp.]
MAGTGNRLGALRPGQRTRVHRTRCVDDPGFHAVLLPAGPHPLADGYASGAVDDAWRRFREHREGAPSSVYPALATVDPDLFGIAVVGTSGQTFTAGEATTEFTIMSVAKPFVLALVCEDAGRERP